MSDRTGKPYERLSRAVFESILRQSHVRNLVVRHNVELRGKHRSHQIDVYWKFAVGRWEYETVVQVKDWKKPVDQGELLKFKAVLDDLRGQVKGIFVSRIGYQQGAIDFAIAHGILIYELREADYPPPLVLTTTGWAHFFIIHMPLRGIIATSKKETIPEKMHACVFVYDVFTPSFSNLHFDVSASWLASRYPATDVPEIRKLNVPSSLLHEMTLYDQEGASVGNLATIFQHVAQDVEKEGVEEKRATHIFQRPTFIGTDSLLIPRVKIDTVSVDVKIEHRHEIRPGRMANFPQWVLRELNSGRTDWFGATPAVASLLPRKTPT